MADDWVAEMLSDLAAGAAWVIAEGRESGTVGLFDASGAVHGELVDAILHAVGTETVIFEAPQRAQQAWLLRHVGPNVNLGNIRADDVIALETLRRGLRYDTLDLLPPLARPSATPASLSRARARRDRLRLRGAHRRAVLVDPPACLRDRRAALGEHRVHRLRRRAAGTVRVAIAAAGSSASARHPRRARAAGRAARRGGVERGRVERAALATARPTTRYAER